MNEEKQIILRMLNEEKITVEEAEALLDAVQEAEEDASRRESATEGKATSQDESPRTEGREEASEAEDSDPNDWFGESFQNFQDLGKKIGDSVSGILKDIDFDRIKEDVKGAVDNVKDELKNMDFDGDISSVMNRAFGKSKAIDEKELTIQPEGIERLQIEDSWGSINAVGGDADTVLIKATVVAWGKDEEEADEIAKTVQINTQSEDGVLKVAPILEMEGQKRRFKVDFDVQIPKRFSTTLNTKSGDISLSTIDGEADLTSMSGNVKATAVGSQTRIRTKSGDIWGEDINGATSVSAMSGDVSLSEVGGMVECSAKSGDISVQGGTGDTKLNLLSGDVSIKERLGNIEAKTKSGDIELSDVNGSIICKTLSGDIKCNAEILGDTETSSMSGDVKITAAQLSGREITCKTMGGDCLLTVPEDAGLDVNVETKAGSLSTDFAGEGLEVDDKKKTMAGSVNGGGTKVTISGLGGSVKIAKG